MKTIRTPIEPFVLSQQQLADLVLEQMDAAVLLCDNQSKIVLANPAAQKMCGGDPVGQVFSDAFPLSWIRQEDDPKIELAFGLEPVLAGDTLRGRAALKPPGQPRREVTIHSAPYRGPTAEILCCIVSMMEISESEQEQQHAIVPGRQPTRSDANGIPVTGLEADQDITDRKKREDAQAFLIRATNELTESLDFETTLSGIARLAVPFLADWCAVHILMDDGIIRRLAFAHQDPAVIAHVTARPQQYALDENVKHLVPYVLRTGRTELFNQVPDSVLQEAARDQAHLETLRQLGLQAYLCMPLQARGRILGTVTFAMSESGRTFSVGDVELAHELVRRAGLAADNARLFEESQVAQARLRIISEVSNELFASLNYETRMERLAQVVVPHFADWCTINVVEADGSVRLAGLAHADPEMLPVIREWVATHPLTLEGASGTPNVIRTGKAEWVGDIRERIPPADDTPTRLAYLERLQVRSYIVVPLIARERVLGAITFAQSGSERHFTFQDLLTAEQIARRAAIALDNAALYAQEQQARQQAEAYAVRVTTLQNVTASLATALTPKEVATSALLPILSALGAYAGSVSLLSGDGETIEMIETHGYDAEIKNAWSEYPLSMNVPIARAIQTGKTLLLSDPEALRTDYPDIWTKQSGLLGKAWAAIPLVLEGRVLGALGVTFQQQHRFDAQEEAFMNALAQQTALAMERAQLYEAERAARAFAEQNAARVSALQRITGMLGTALTREQVADVVVEHGMNALNAQGGVVTQLGEDGKTIHILKMVGYPASISDTWKKFPVDANLAMAEVIRTSEPLVFESPREILQRYPQRVAPSQPFGAWIIVPLEFKGRVSGGLTLAYNRERSINQADRAFAIALAQQCAQAMERARLYESELEARQAAEHAAQRSEWLTEASHVLSSSLDYEATLGELAQLVVSELADWCTIDMAKGDGTAEQLVLAHRDPEKLKWAKEYGEEIKQYFKPNWDSPIGLPNVLRTGKPEIYYDIPATLLEQVAENEVQLNILKSIGYSSVIIVPLTVQDKTLGAITMVNTDSGRHFTDEDLAFAQLFAERAAVAMENARLYRELQAVNTELQSLNTELERRVGQRTFELSEAYDDLSKEVVERTRAEETTRALLRISNKLNSSLDVETTLEILIQEAIRVMEGTGGFAGLRTGNGMRMHKYFANGKSIPIEFTWERGKGMPGWVLEHGTPYVTNDAPNDRVMQHELPFDAGVQNAICTPIHDAQGEVLGFFEVRDKIGRAPFTGADVEFLLALSPIASIAIENAQAYQKISQAESVVQASYAQLRALAARLQTIREEERTDIARELHDELGQALTALKMDVASLLSRLPQRNKQLRERAQAMSEQIDVTIKAVRRMSSQLRPGMLDDLGLGPSLEWYGQEFQTRTGIIVETQVPERDLDLSQSQATALYRIFQETLTNVARHAQATRVQAKLELHDDIVELQISDDGVGIDLEQARVKRSLGLLGMRERAEMVHGTFEIQGQPGAGTTILVRLSLGS